MKTIQVGKCGRSRRGMALLYSVFAAFTAATMVAVLVSLSLSGAKISVVKHFGGKAEYLAQGALEAAKHLVQSETAAWRTPPANGTVTIDGTAVSFTITPIAPDGVLSNIKPWSPSDPPVVRTDPSGLQTIVTSYLVEASATVQDTTATAHRLIQAEATPVFQFAVFYNSDLEVNPGPSMTLSGRIHTNSDLYMGSNHTLTLDTNYVHSAGNIYRHRKDVPTASAGTVTIRNWVANPFDPSEPSSYFAMNSALQMGAVPSNGGYDSDFTTGYDSNGDGDFTDAGDWLPWGPGALDYWSEVFGYAGGTGSTVKDSAHGVTSAAPPPLDSIHMFEPATGTGDWSLVGGNWMHTPGAGTHDKGFYHAAADLTIVANAAHTAWTAYDAHDHDVTSQIPAGAVTLSRLYDARQAGGPSGTSSKVPTLKIDMGLLGTSAAWPANGLLYVGCNNKGTGTKAKGVQLFNGAGLASKLTTVSDGALYVQGDYNTSAKKGCAVIGDSVNLLSNAWDGTKTKGGAVPVAVPTTFNTAIVTGNTETIPGSTYSYSGGFENLPRFHENWGGIVCTVNGSFVNFWPSEHATSPWGYAGVYTAPVRAWGYDPLFNTVANLPPFTPMTVVAVDVVCW
ncbi:MAG TPA: hypothetical protein VM509_14200 [Planctomycetota bacterium]|nr:hypothetical protein [Planctomycetota bacterium]